MAISVKRAQFLSLFSLIISVLFFIATFLLGQYTNYYLISSLSWLIGSAALIWLVLLIQFYQRSLAEQEKLDMANMPENEDMSSTIFKARAASGELLALAQRRLKFLEKWCIPIFSVIIAVYQAFFGLLLLRGVSDISLKGSDTLISVVVLAAVGFISFLLSRYAMGMSKLDKWKPLAAGAAALIGIAVICGTFAVILGLGFLVKFFNNFLPILNWFIPVLLLVLGIETGFNVIFDIYRPRIKGQYNRAPFDSRLLGVLNEAGGIFHTAASALDYQFGFQVSQTWFYKLLEKAIVPMILFAIATLYLLSSIVVIEPDEQAVIERLGNPIKNADSLIAVYEPGIHFKLPWPIDTCYRYPVKRIMQLDIGYTQEIDEYTGLPVRGPRLWNKKHYADEEKILVANTNTEASAVTQAAKSGAVPVNIVLAAIPVQYRVKDITKFIYNNYQDKEQDQYHAVKLLENICYQQLTEYAASAVIEVDPDKDLDNSLLGAGRVKAKIELTERIQDAADNAGLGIEIVFVGLQGIHPPTEVAADYEKVVGAVQEKQAKILMAYAQSNQILSTLAGSIEKSDQLHGLILDYQNKKGELADDTNDLEKKLDLAFYNASGEVFQILRNAQSEAYKKVADTKAIGERYQGQLQAFKVAGDIYVHDLRLKALEKALEGVRKYVILANKDQYQIQEVDLKDKLTTGVIDDVSTYKETSK